jgi:hypothetical protein
LRAKPQCIGVFVGCAAKELLRPSRLAVRAWQALLRCRAYSGRRAGNAFFRRFLQRFTIWFCRPRRSVQLGSEKSEKEMHKSGPLIPRHLLNEAGSRENRRMQSANYPAAKATCA